MSGARDEELQDRRPREGDVRDLARLAIAEEHDRHRDEPSGTGDQRAGRGEEAAFHDDTARIVDGRAPSDTRCRVRRVSRGRQRA